MFRTYNLVGLITSGIGKVAAIYNSVWTPSDQCLMRMSDPFLFSHHHRSPDPEGRLPIGLARFLRFVSHLHIMSILILYGFRHVTTVLLSLPSLDMDIFWHVLVIINFPPLLPSSL
jgi:hypothetical protein